TATPLAAARREPRDSKTLNPQSPPSVISRLDMPVAKNESPPTTVPPPPPPRPTIPIDLPPNGTGVPASEIVPALSGPPVPTVAPPPPPVPLVPPRIPFRITAPSEDIRPKFIRIPGSEPREHAGVPSKLGAGKAEAKIVL